MPENAGRSQRFSPETVVSRYAVVSRFYDWWARLTETKALARALELSEIHDGMNILEVAVGTGRLFSRIVTRNPHGRNTGLDLSPHMLARARKRLARMRSATWGLQIGSADTLPYRDETFDRVFNTYMLDLLPVDAFPGVLTEFNRVLRPGGRLILVTFGFGRAWYHRFWFWVARTFPALLPNCQPVHLSDLSRYGFRVVHTEMVSQNTFPSAMVIAEKVERV